MEYQGVCDKIFKIREALQDEQSEILFDARLNYSISRDKWQFYKAVDLFEKTWHCHALETFMNQSDGSGIVIWGCGHDGREAKRVLDVCGYHLDCFCDSNSSLAGTQADGIQVISVDEMLEKCKGYSVIIGSSKYREEMQNVLSEHGFPSRNVLCAGYGHLQAYTGKKQYFDVLKPEKDEVFVDAGAYDGGTILDFLQWTDGKYQKIYAMEPLRDMYCRIKEMCEQKHIDYVDIREIAAWNKEEKLYFTEELTGSRVEKEGAVVVNGLDIDSIVKEDRVTYIKMDIEGSELKALEGAKKVIQRNRPKLAVSLYHKFEDIVELPAYILELVPEYKFYIRHYCSDFRETVLYATL
ncbi:MAG: FkbM family methyltransferase [Lachnospiraceae bacterium]|nr:FkbM family methyltransferase [Lachnospiraceae bacterium]